MSEPTAAEGGGWPEGSLLKAANGVGARGSRNQSPLVVRVRFNPWSAPRIGDQGLFDARLGIEFRW